MFNRIKSVYYTEGKREGFSRILYQKRKKEVCRILYGAGKAGLRAYIIRKRNPKKNPYIIRWREFWRASYNIQSGAGGFVQYAQKHTKKENNILCNLTEKKISFYIDNVKNICYNLTIENKQNNILKEFLQC
jgi:hypothetical protein